jgi:hypothetical protein
MEKEFYVINTSRYNIILGILFWQDYTPKFNWQKHQVFIQGNILPVNANNNMDLSLNKILMGRKEFRQAMKKGEIHTLYAIKLEKKKNQQEDKENPLLAWIRLAAPNQITGTEPS